MRLEHGRHVRREERDPVAPRDPRAAERRREPAHAAAELAVGESAAAVHDGEPVRLIGVYSDPANHQIITYPDGNVIHYVSTVFECAIRGGALECGCESLELRFFPPDELPPDTLPISRIRIADAVARQVEAFVR
jgi:hypothetical protein